MSSCSSCDFTPECRCCEKEKRRLNGLIQRLDAWLCDNRILLTTAKQYSVATIISNIGFPVTQYIKGDKFSTYLIFPQVQQPTSAKIYFYNYVGCMCGEKKYSIKLFGGVDTDCYDDPSDCPVATTPMSWVSGTHTSRILLSGKLSAKHVVSDILRAESIVRAARITYSRLKNGLDCC